MSATANSMLTFETCVANKACEYGGESYGPNAVHIRVSLNATATNGLNYGWSFPLKTKTPPP